MGFILRLLARTLGVSLAWQERQKFEGKVEFVLATNCHELKVKRPRIESANHGCSAAVGLARRIARGPGGRPAPQSCAGSDGPTVESVRSVANVPARRFCAASAPVLRAPRRAARPCPRRPALWLRTRSRQCALWTSAVQRADAVGGAGERAVTPSSSSSDDEYRCGVAGGPGSTHAISPACSRVRRASIGVCMVIPCACACAARRPHMHAYATARPRPCGVQPRQEQTAISWQGDRRQPARDGAAKRTNLPPATP